MTNTTRLPSKNKDMPKNWEGPHRCNRIQEVLNAEGRTQVWLAEKVGLSRNGLNAICKNKSQPTLITLFKIAEALKCDPCELLDDGKPLSRTRKTYEG